MVGAFALVFPLRIMPFTSTTWNEFAAVPPFRVRILKSLASRRVMSVAAVRLTLLLPGLPVEEIVVLPVCVMEPATEFTVRKGVTDPGSTTEVLEVILKPALVAVLISEAALTLPPVAVAVKGLSRPTERVPTSMDPVVAVIFNVDVVRTPTCVIEPADSVTV